MIRPLSSCEHHVLGAEKPVSGANPFFIVLSGPTGVGKTAFSVELSRRLPVEIINGDMGQLYQPLSIGTAKPPKDTYACPTHFFDYLTKPVSFSSMAFRHEAERCMRGIWERGNIPLIVGGTLFYCMSLFFPPIAKREDSGRATLTTDYAHLSTAELWELLHTLDPVRAAAVSRNDRYRLDRALQLWHQHGVPPSSLLPAFNPLGRFLFVFLTRDRAELYARIESRCDEMISEGFLQEVEGLSAEWRSFVREKKLIGYPEMLDVAEGHLSINEAIAFIKKQTRNYAKRQNTFWRMLHRRLADAEAASWGDWGEANLTLHPLHLYIEQVVSQAHQMRIGREDEDNEE